MLDLILLVDETDFKTRSVRLGIPPIRTLAVADARDYDSILRGA
jgi:hypothetical protein